MKSILVPLYWLWCGVSVFVLVRRRINKNATSTEQGNEPTTIAATPTTASTVPAPIVEPVGVAETAVAPPMPTMTSPAILEPAGAVLSAAVPVSTVESLAEALEGICLPETLAPLMGGGEFDPGCLVLFTNDAPAEVVGTAMADEFERLGFRVTPLDEQRVLALTDAATIEAMVHPDGTVRDESGNPRFPTAPVDSVVMELRLR